MKIEFFNKTLLRSLEQYINGDNIKPYIFSNGINLAFDKITINRTADGAICLNMGEGCGSDYLKVWRAGIPGLVIKDIKKNRVDHYYEFITPDIKSIIRTLSDDEYDVCIENPTLSDCIITKGDFKFIIIKIVKADDSFATRVNPLYSYDDIERDNSADSEDESEEDEEVEEDTVKSYSLFED